LTASKKVQLPFDRLTALSKAEGLRYASSFVIAAYCMYASFLKIRKPCIWSFLLYRSIFDFYEFIKTLTSPFFGILQITR
jgi:hypothetical protein